MSSELLFAGFAHAGVALVLFAGSCTFLQKSYRCFVAHTVLKISEETRTRDWDTFVVYEKPDSVRGGAVETDSDEATTIRTSEIESKRTEQE